MWPREDLVDTFSCWLFRGGHVVIRRGRNAKGSEQQTSDIIDLSISVLLNYKIFDRRDIYSRTPLCVTNIRILLALFIKFYLPRGK